MKAAVLNALGERPKYTDFENPVSENSEQLLIHVKAASVKNLDKAIASGSHYSSKTHSFQAEVVGVDGVGKLKDGKLKIDTVTANLADVEKAWTQDIPSGKRLVIVI